MLPLDIDKFWKDDLIAHKNNCFYEDSPQVALGIRMSDECVFAELNEPGTPWAPIPLQKRIDLNKRYNDLAQKIVGVRLLREEFLPEDSNFPETRRIGDVFGGKYYYHNDTEWLEGHIETTDHLDVVLDRVDKLNMREFILPQNWESEKKRIFETYGIKPARVRHVRGPITLVTSLMGGENMIYTLMDAPELMARFAQTITKVIMEISDLFDEEAGFTMETAPHGFSFADDNCCLLNPELYKILGYPVLKAIFERYSPNSGDGRYQHSDSAMGQLLPVLSDLRFTGVNFGPTVLIDEIRKFMPIARIDGCIAPFTFMNNDIKKITAECKRDFEMAKACNKGVNLTTAGSINNGSSLESLRHIMALIQNYGRY